MKKNVLLLMAAMVLGGADAAAQTVADTVRTVELDAVQVTSLRATSRTPMAVSNVGKEQIQAVNYGQDLPMLLSTQPSVTVTTDAGNGIGYTSIRVRGTDPSRINVTANGVPINDGESSLTYFSNMGDFASSVQSIQVQRGVGTSTNGAGAFGATINMLTDGIPAKPFIGFDASAGSYGSHKETLRFGTGLLGGKFGVQGRLSNIGSDGYIDRATSSLNSYFLQAAYYGERTSIKFLTFNGTEKTYMAWNYTSKYEQEQYGRRYNSCGLYYDKDGRMCFYNDQFDNYHQQHYQLHLNHLVSDRWKLNVALHYTHDTYVYDQMKTGKTLYLWNLTDDDELRGNLVQRKDGDKDFGGLVGSMNYDNRRGLTMNFGGALNFFDADHFGHVIWVGTPYYKGAEGAPVPLSGIDPNHRYYGNNAKKMDGNIYAKVQWEFVKGLSAFADLQYRHVGYKIKGMTDNWDDVGQIRINLDAKFDFFNPKFGLNWQLSPNHRVYASYAVAQREPTRDNYMENMGEPITSERLFDFEFGYQYQSEKFTAGLNLYHMNYHDQFVLTGLLNDEGEAITKNIPHSYRMGMEIEAAWKPLDWLRWDMNMTLSKNRAKDMVITLDDYSTLVNVGETKLAFSPDVIFNNSFTFLYKGFSAMLQSQYISKQNLTNYGFESMYSTATGTWETLQLKAHFTTNLDISYNFSLPELGLKQAKAGVTFYNLFGCKYDNNGWAAPQFQRDSNGEVMAVNTWGKRDAEAAGFAPSAPFHFMAHLSLNF